jgi:Zn-dependent protease
MTLLAHELSHALVGRAHGLQVRSITLFALGGIASIEREPASARVEFWMAAAGPITSVAIGIGCVAVARSLGWSLEGSAPGPVAATPGWLGSINLVLAVFNLIPGYPLDGGRVLRAILWAVWGNAERATRSAARVGQAVAGWFIVLGLFRFFGGADAGGLWLAFIGWFLMDAAGASYAQAAIRTQRQGIRAADLMRRDCDTIAGGATLEAFADLLFRTGRRCFMVTGPDGRIDGLITPQEVRAVDRRRWPEVRSATQCARSRR